jgi:hypothetical protein
MYFFDEGFTFRNFLIDVLTIAVFVFWFWLVITVAVDLFRRSDISGWGKAFWVIGWIVFPFIAVLAYLIFHGKGMAERNQQRASPILTRWLRGGSFLASTSFWRRRRTIETMCIQ